LLADAARPCRHLVGDRWQVDETYVKVAGQWRYVYRAIDQFGQVIDVFVSPRRDAKAAHRFLERAIGATRWRPWRSPPIRRWCTRRAGGAAARGLAPHRPVQQQPRGGRPGRLKARLRPMRGLKQDRNPAVIFAGHAFVHNVRRGH
jgi:transposase, IS6 family